MEVQKVEYISYSAFIREFYQPGIPVIFKNASKSWKANGVFNPDWFREYYGDRQTEVAGKQFTMRQIMDMVENSSVNDPAPYPCIFNIPETLPEIMDLIQPLHLNYARPNWFENKWFTRGHWGSATELFIGGPGGKFPYIHLDYFHLNAWITQLYGEKRFTIFPSGQEDLLYPIPEDPWRSEINIFEPDFQKFPKYKEATPIHFVVGPGETLFIPAGTWHTAYSLTPTISVAFDQLNSKNYKDFIMDVWSFRKKESTLKAIVKTVYAWLAGQACKLDDSLHPQK
jgi:histone arginine demethylase JMJD6